MNEQNQISAKVQLLRSSQNRTQTDVATRMSMHVANYRRLEQGNQRWTEALIRKAAGAFKVPVWELFGEDPHAKPPMIAALEYAAHRGDVSGTLRALADHLDPDGGQPELDALDRAFLKAKRERSPGGVATVMAELMELWEE